MTQRVALISNGDGRDSACRVCWPNQEKTLADVSAALRDLGAEPFLAHTYDSAREHGFITSQAEGCRVFAELDPDVPVIVVLSCWAYSHHVASSVKVHKGPKLILGNFDGTWPGLVALLNHCGTLERMNAPHSRIWSLEFQGDPQFMGNLKTWLGTGVIDYPTDHITNARDLKINSEAMGFGRELGADILKNKRILGQLDPGCMGMLNAVLDLGKLAAIGMPVEYLSQSDLMAEMWLVNDGEAQACLDWLTQKGANFHWGEDEENELTKAQVFEQMKMYVAAGRIFERFGLSAIGVPYQLGLVRCTPASDLCEGMWNNAERPDILSDTTGKPIRPGAPLPHFNEGDLGSGVPQTLMCDILTRKGMPPETTLHDVRWGEEYQGEFAWVLEISGGVPPAHFGGWDKVQVYRQPKMYFPKGGGTCTGVGVAGVNTWARVYEKDDALWMDCGTARVIEMPDEEVRRRWEATTKEWPIANTVTPGYDRDQMMATHMSNHITVCYGDILAELAATGLEIGLNVNVVGEGRDSLS